MRMLEQFRQDAQNEDVDFFQESSSRTGRKKLIFFLTGSCLALVLFLFLFGPLSSNDSSGTTGRISSSQSDDHKRLETQVAMLSQRLERLENHMNPSQPQQELFNPVTDSQQFVASEEPVAYASKDTEKPFDGQMSDDAIKQMILGATPVEPQVVATPQPVQTPAKPTNNYVMGTTYIVQRGDTLSKISQKCYGTSQRWKEIFEANRDKIPNVNSLKVGSKLVIPEKADKATR